MKEELKRVVLPHSEILKLEARGEIIPNFPPKERYFEVKPDVRRILAAEFHKTIEHWRLKNSPKVYPLTEDIDRILQRFYELGFRQLMKE